MATGRTIVIFGRSRRLQKHIHKGYLKISGEHLSTLRAVYLLRNGLFMTSDSFFKDTCNDNLIIKVSIVFFFSSTVLLSMRLGIDVNRHKVSM